MARNIVPRTDKGADLGTPAKNWNTVYTDKVVANVVNGGNLSAVEQSAGDEVTLRSLIATAGSNPTSITVYDDIPITTTDLTIPSNVNLRFKDNGKLSPVSGITLTINGGIDAGLFQIFSGEGTIAGTPKINYIYPEWFGAVGDGIADDTAALQAAADFAKQTNNSVGGTSNKFTITLKGAQATYKVTSTVTFHCTGDMGNSTIISDSSFSPTILIGDSGLNVAAYVNFITPTVRNTSKTTGSGWDYPNILTPGAVGIECANLNESFVTITKVANFEIGVDITAYDKGNCYNIYTLNMIVQNKIGLRVQPKTDGGWTNENIFMGGRFVIYSDETGYTAGTRNIELIPSSSTGKTIDNLLFIKPSLESNLVDYKVYAPDHISDITFLQARWEGTSPVNVYGGGVMFVGGDGVNSIVNDNSFVDLNIKGPITERSKLYDGKHITSNSNIHIAGYDNDSLGANGLNDKDRTSTDWIYKLHNDGIQLKAPLTATNQPTIDLNGAEEKIKMRVPGEASRYIAAYPSGFKFYGDVYPYSDGGSCIGSASLRWNAVYAVDGTINTSDERKKQDIRDISEKEKAVALKIKSMMKAFRFKDAVSKKGDEARIHFGAVAQDVAKAFQDEGLDPFKYALFCYDEWDETPERKNYKGKTLQEHKPAGNLYGIRYNELLSFIIAAM